MSRVMSNSRISLAVFLPLVMLVVFVSVRSGSGRVRSAVATPDVFTVTNLNDSGEGSFRDAIAQANALAGADSIVFQDELSGTITLTSGELFITDDLTITGPGIFSIIVSGNHASRVFHVGDGVNVSISGLTIADGNAPTGGGIYSTGPLALTNVVVSGNSGGSAGGGIVIANSTLTLDSSTISGNVAGSGGGILNANSVVTITKSTVSGNTANGGGGGLGEGGGIENCGTLTIINSTISGNTASARGGGIYNCADAANLSFVTLSGNSAPDGGGIFAIGGTVNVKNSIVANSPSGGDCSIAGTLNATGANFSTSGTCPGFTQVTPAQLNLGPLADNGGPTKTHALLVGSVAIDAANDCTDLSKNPVNTDQRGIGRPQGNACDAGAYEFVPCNTSPTITCNEDFTVSTDATQCAAVVSFTPPQSDCPCNGGGFSKPSPKAVKSPSAPKEGSTCTVTCAPPSGSTFPRGTTTVTCTAADINGNSAQCSFSITVTDQTPPAVSCPANIVRSTDPNQCSTAVSYTATANDNCDGPLTPTCAPPSGSTFQKGTTTVTCMASDSSKNTGACSFTVTVNDSQPPVITCPANIIAPTPAGTTPCVTINYAAPAVSDNCPLPPPGVAVCSPPSGSCFARGVTTVTCSVTDAGNNTSSCSFTVTVFDLCLQDDSNPSTVVLVSTATGDYRFCCGGTVFTGRGKVTARSRSRGRSRRRSPPAAGRKR